jgi:PAS domain-containing protein
MWETRYEIVRPTRGAGGQRMYTDEDLAVLRAVTMLVGRGHSIGELATWPRKDLLSAAREHEVLDTSENTVAASPVGLGEAVIVALDHEGIVHAVSPAIERVLGWPHGMLVGQPIWGLLVDVPAAFEKLVTRAAAPADGTIFWVWMRTRSGGAIPCRFACGQRRRASEGTSLTVTINALGEGARLGSLLDHVAEAGLARFSGSPEQVLADYVSNAVEEHGAALARVWTYKPSDGTLHMVASAGLSKSVATSQRSVIQLSSYRFKVGVVARTGIPYLHNGLEADRDFDRRWIKREKLESAAVVPLIRGGQLFGVMAQFFQRRLGPADVGKLQSALALCEASLKSRPPRGRSR